MSFTIKVSLINLIGVAGFKTTDYKLYWGESGLEPLLLDLNLNTYEVDPRISLFVRLYSGLFNSNMYEQG